MPSLYEMGCDDSIGLVVKVPPKQLKIIRGTGVAVGIGLGVIGLSILGAAAIKAKRRRK